MVLTRTSPTADASAISIAGADDILFLPPSAPARTGAIAHTITAPLRVLSCRRLPPRIRHTGAAEMPPFQLQPRQLFIARYDFSWRFSAISPRYFRHGPHFRSRAVAARRPLGLLDDFASSAHFTAHTFARAARDVGARCRLRQTSHMRILAAVIILASFGAGAHQRGIAVASHRDIDGRDTTAKRRRAACRRHAIYSSRDFAQRPPAFSSCAMARCSNYRIGCRCRKTFIIHYIF